MKCLKPAPPLPAVVIIHTQSLGNRGLFTLILLMNSNQILSLNRNRLNTAFSHLKGLKLLDFRNDKKHVTHLNTHTHEQRYV